jgi:hypothetical protein
MGLINLLSMNMEEIPDPDVMSHLQTAVTELDQMIQAITRKL